ncbi:MAG: response regulator [Acidobacteriota bacterium]|jgi:DNA-binding response OmpR family regulator|nr:MAG: two-component system response regulator [Thermoanaerobaculum sp.]
MKRVLFVDDDEAILELYRQVFGGEGYEVSTCLTMDEAREHLAKFPVDAVVLDIRLAEGLGLALLREIKAKTPTLPVILSTAYARYQDDFSSWLADEYVVKSADLAELRSALRRHLGEAP